MKILSLASGLLSVLILTGCHARFAHPVNNNVYHKVAEEARDVQVFQGKPARSYTVVAVVDSFLSAEFTREVKRNQLLDLQRKAMEAGGDGLVELEALEEQREGMIIDPTLPSGTWKQGDFGLVFLRAKAVRFQTPEWEERQSTVKENTIEGLSQGLGQSLDLDSIEVQEAPKQEAQPNFPAY